MTETSVKRKDPPGGAGGPHNKRSKGGRKGKWQTPGYQARLEKLRGRSLAIGDAGFWATCQRHKEGEACKELLSICDYYGEKLYGIKPEGDGADDDGSETADIEASIKNEVDIIKAGDEKEAVFEPLRFNLDCLLFVRTRTPVEPCEFVMSICQDATLATTRPMKSRFLNRFSPITLTGKATERGLVEVAESVLGKHFQLASAAKDEGIEEKGTGASYAIRPSFRAHDTLKRDDVISKVASLIGPRHKVNLSRPDKVILIEIYTTFCGMSVVDGDWEGGLKRYNINELYKSASKKAETATDRGDCKEAREQGSANEAGAGA